MIDLKCLEPLENLEDLDLSMSDLSAQDIGDNKLQLKNLARLSLSQNHLTASILQFFSGSTTVKTFISRYDYCTDDNQVARGLEYLACFKNLQQLTLTKCNISDECSGLFMKLTKLVHLDLTGCPHLGNKCLENIAKLEDLEYLNLDTCYNVTKKGIQHLSNLKQLKYLSLLGLGYLRDENLVHLPENLEELDLTDWYSLTNEGLKHLSKLTNIKNLDLSSCEKNYR